MLRLAVAVLVSISMLGGIAVGQAPASGGGPIGTGAASSASSSGRVLIDELANGGPRSASDGFVELRNHGRTAVRLDGWALFRCSAQGLRANAGRSEGDLTGHVLAPGGRLVISRVGMPGDLHVTQPYAASGFGFVLVDASGATVDRVGVYPNEPWMTQSECTGAANLPNRLDVAGGESWQRVATTGDPRRDFVAAPATLGTANATEPTPESPATVVISEFATQGRGGDGDDLVELRNAGAEPVDLSGFELFRCTASGRLGPETRQVRIADDTVLRPGQRWLLGGPDFAGAPTPDDRASTSLADAGAGVLLRDAQGRTVDRVSMSAYADSPCQAGEAKLAPILDAVADESYQRRGEEWIVAPRTPGRPNAVAERSVVRAAAAAPDAPGGLAATVSAGPGGGDVRISEVATDPADLPTGAVQRNLVEIANLGDVTVDIGGWSVRRCERDGTRALAVQAAVPAGTALRPGGTWTVAAAGTPAAADADAVAATRLHFQGAGVWLADARGTRVDSVGIYGRNEMDASIERPSPCTNGVSLMTTEVDRLEGETFQRVALTGVDADDFRAMRATPGRVVPLDGRATALDDDGARAHRPLADAAGPASAARAPRATPPALAVPAGAGPVSTGAAVVPPGAAAGLRHAAPDVEPAAVRVMEAWAGVTDPGPLSAERGDRERRIEADRLGTPVRDAAWGRPYQRLVIGGEGVAPGGELVWRGASSGRNELQLSVWNPTAERWRGLDAGVDPTASGATIELRGRLREGEARAGVATLLVQDGPRTEPTLASARTGRDAVLERPADYDFAVSHITDTQYLSESYPEVYEQLVGWIADNADERRIAFATHTGDLVQNWVDPDQHPARARLEYGRASRMQAILDEAGVPNSVLPGNHDTKRGVDDRMFNEFFPPSRYADLPWYGGSIGLADHTANFSLVEAGGARLLMLSLPYAYDEADIAWAERVVHAHRDRDVILSTHEHLSPKMRDEPAARSVSSRWVSRAAELWDRVVAPNRNVVAVLSGHFHGVGQVVTGDAGGIPGHDVVELLADYQEFRTHTGERSTGFQRLLQVDLASGTVAVDTFSATLRTSAAHEHDYGQFVPDDGSSGSRSNDRPWNIVAAGLQGRYTGEDDEFLAPMPLRYPKSVATSSVGVVAGG